MIIRPYQPRDKERAVEILLAAFREDPAFARIAALAPGADEEAVLRALFDLQVGREYAPAGAIDVAEDEGRIYGVALWNPPGARLGLRERAQVALGYARIFGPGALTLYRHERELDAYHPAFPHWYLYALAVSPDAQGRGVGTSLLRSGMDRAGRQAIYLEASTPRSARLYESLGFAALGELPRHGAGPSELAMWRPAAR